MFDLMKVSKTLTEKRKKECGKRLKPKKKRTGIVKFQLVLKEKKKWKVRVKGMNAHNEIDL